MTPVWLVLIVVGTGAPAFAQNRQCGDWQLSAFDNAAQFDALRHPPDQRNGRQRINASRDLRHPERSGASLLGHAEISQQASRAIGASLSVFALPGRRNHAPDVDVAPDCDLVDPFGPPAEQVGKERNHLNPCVHRPDDDVAHLRRL